MVKHDLDDFLIEKSSGILQLAGARMALLDIESGFWGIRRQMEALIGSRLTNSVLQQAGVNGGASFARSFISTIDQSDAAAFSACLQVYQSAGFGHFETTTLEWPLGRISIRADQAFEAWMVAQHSQVSNSPCCAYTAGVLVGFVNVISDRRDVVCIETFCQGKGDEFCQFELLPAAVAEDQTVVAFLPDPALGRQLNLLELLFERMPMGIAVLDREYRIQRYNPTWYEFAERYAPLSGAALTPGVGYFDHLPGSEPVVIPMLERALAGETVRQNGIRLESAGSVSYWDIVLAPLEENSEIVGILNVAVDATERIEARQNLEKRVEERTRQLQMLLDVSAAANSSLNLDEMLAKTLDILVALTGASRAGVSLLDEETGQLKAGILRPERVVDPAELAKMMSAGQTVIESGEMMVIEPDISKGLLEPGVLLPIQIRNRNLGFLGIIGKMQGVFTQAQLTLFKSIADQLGVAIDNAFLFKKAEEAAITAERNRLARDLHDAVTQTLFSASLVAEVLPKIWEKNPDEGRRRLEEVRQLTRGALSEMRTLLLELRPAALIDTDLGDLIGHQVNAFIARTRLEVEYKKDVNGNPPPAVKEVFYRVVQEGLTNIAKHAEATKVDVDLTCQPDNLKLTISDNGCGFNRNEVSADHLGLTIMDERARGIHANLTINSNRDQGTMIQLSWESADMEIIIE